MRWITAPPTPARLREFVQLHERLREIGFAGVASLSLPPKRLFDSLTAGVVSRRRDALERYLNAVLSHAHSMREFPPLRFFLQVPERLVRAGWHPAQWWRIPPPPVPTPRVPTALLSAAPVYRESPSCGPWHGLGRSCDAARAAPAGGPAPAPSRSNLAGGGCVFVP